jgi:hypothetical protein
MLSGIVAVCCAGLFAVSARANTIWTVHVDVTSGKDQPVYTISSSPIKAHNCDPNNTADTSKGDVPICPGDSIQWVFETGGKKGSLTIHLSKDVLNDNNGNAKYWITAKEGAQDTYTEDPSVSAGIFKYCIAIYDDNGNKSRVYTHDPKIIVGGGHSVELLKFEAACNDLVASIKNASDADKAKGICETAENKFQKLLSLK